ncbi:MAG: TonB-dependent receptor [Burkholderiales bacterium]|nr:TonB-dependent receptor [Burkholderiales bacterium]
MRTLRQLAVSLAAAHSALLGSAPVWAQPAAAGSGATDASDAAGVERVVVVGQREAMQSAQRIKQTAEELVDSIVAEDIGKLPDKSVSEVLQRVVGVSIDRTMSNVKSLNDGVEKFSIVGAGVSIRGLSYVRSETNGRESFSANGGRAISFEDVPPELLAGVDVYKNPSAAQIEGGIGGLVNLRTWKPFDFPGSRVAVSLSAEESSLRRQPVPSFSGLATHRWHTDLGHIGALISYSRSAIRDRTDAFHVEPYFPRTDALAGDTSGTTYWVPSGVSWRSIAYDREREGLHATLQWRRGDVQSSLGYVEARHRLAWTENASYFYGDRWATTLDAGATFGPTGALRTGVLHGVVLGTDVRYADSTSRTRDLAWHLQWDASDRWTLSTDLQRTQADVAGYDNTVGLKTLPLPKQQVDLSGSVPRLSFDQADRDFLADPAHYFWNFTQDHREDNTAEMTAWRGDATYQFDSHPVLRQGRVGVRLTDRHAVSRQTDGGYHWAPITESWLAPGGQLAMLSDPRFAQDVELHRFDRFFGGAAGMPASVLVPQRHLVQNLPGSFEKLHAYRDALCRDAYPDPAEAQACINRYSWVTPTGAFGTPRWSNPQTERTQALYGQLNFAAPPPWQLPLEGHVGVRVVRTEVGAVGRLVFTPQPVPGAPVFDPIDPDTEVNYRSTYTRVLPSLNLLYRASDKLQLRAAAARAMARPDFYHLQGYIQLSQNIPTGYPNTSEPITYSGDGSRSNPFLKPTMAQSFDLSAEYYFSRAGSFTVGVFHKELKDIVVGRTSVYTLEDTTGTPHDFIVSSPINGARGHASGAEIGFQRYLDMLPGWLAGFGLRANATYIDSRQRLYSPLQPTYCTGLDDTTAAISLSLNGCDTDGRTFGNLPLQNLSRRAYNFALLYDQGPLSARLAYTWRDKYLLAANAYGTNGWGGLDTNPDSPTRGERNVAWALPTWAGAYGQWDMGIFHQLNSRVTLGFEAQNLTDATFTQTMQQHIGMMQRAAWSSGRRYALRLQMQL